MAVQLAAGLAAGPPVGRGAGQRRSVVKPACLEVPVGRFQPSAGGGAAAAARRGWRAARRAVWLAAALAVGLAAGLAAVALGRLAVGL